jgi:hypothetical protein
MTCAGSKRRGVPRGWMGWTGWTVAACLIFGLATALQYQQVLRGELWTSIAVPRPVPEAAGVPRERADHLWPPDRVQLHREWEDWDHGFVLWVVSRNAYTLLTEPSRLFGEGPCFPFPKPLVLGHPAITQGILAAPAYAATGNPIFSYNSIMILASFLAALAMYLLVRDWTGSPSAGIAAGLLYAFHGARVSLATYPFKIDLAWVLFAMLFGERYFKQGRWRDALLTALCIALQLSMSLYASLVCVLVLLPYLVWLLTKYGLAKLRPGPVVMALVVIGLSTALVYAPYLGLPETSGNRLRYVALWSGFLPGRFVGWLIFLFALVSLLPGYRESGASRRWALLAACALVLWLATGGNEAAQRIAEKAGDPAPFALPSPYRIFDFLPGLALIRGSLFLATGVHLLLSMLAGLGVARLIRWTPPPWKLAISAVLICVAFTDTLHPELLGRRAPVEFRTLALRPWEQDTRKFFETLEELGNRGPVVEIPSGPPWALHRESSRTLLNAYHHRPTSGCHNSVIPPEVRRVRTLIDRLPDADALRELRSLGFTTLVVHGGATIQEPFRTAAERSELLEEVHATLRRAAYSISP